MEKITTVQQIEERIKLWGKIERNRVDLFNSPGIVNSRTLKLEKLNYLSGLVKSSKGLTGEAKVTRRYLKDEVLKLEKDLYPKKWVRSLERLTRPLRRATENRIDSARLKALEILGRVVATVKAEIGIGGQKKEDSSPKQTVQDTVAQDVKQSTKTDSTLSPPPPIYNPVERNAVSNHNVRETGAHVTSHRVREQGDVQNPNRKLKYRL